MSFKGPPNVHPSKLQKFLEKFSTVNVSWPASMKTAMKLLIWANNFLRSVELETAIAITVTFCSCRDKEIQLNSQEHPANAQCLEEKPN